MPDDLGFDEVERIAALAKLALTAEEKRLFAAQLGRVLDYARVVAELDTRDVPPTAAFVDAASRERVDRPRPCLDQALALGNAPDAHAGLFRVPKVLGDA